MSPSALGAVKVADPPALFQEQAAAIDPSEFRRALGCFPTGVAIITASGPSGEPVGMTVSSFNSVSLEPPLVLFSVARKAFSTPAIQQAGAYSVNVLSHAQTVLSDQFARGRADKWNGVDFIEGYGGSRRLPDALVTFECRPYRQYDGGDHIIFVAEVASIARSESPEKPLVFYRGRYHGLADLV